MKLKVVWLELLVFAAMVLVATPVLAYLYRAPITVIESNGTSYTQLPLMVSMNNDWLASNGFMDADALDTRVQTLAGSDSPWMIADDRTLFSIPVPSNSQTNLYFVTGEASAASMNIIAGRGGYVTTADNAALELGDDFEIEIDGYINTSQGSGDYLSKIGAFMVYNSASGEITADIMTTPIAYPQVTDASGGYAGDGSGATPDNYVDLPSSIDANDLLLGIVAVGTNHSLTWPSDWTEMEQVYMDASAGRLSIAYKIADGTEDGTQIDILCSTGEYIAYTFYAIQDYSGIPELGTAVAGTSVNPDPPSLTPSWGNIDTLWFAIEANDSSPTVSGYPASYSNGLNYGNSFVHIGSARRENATATEDPGVFTISGSDQWVAQTIAIQPAYAIDKSVVITGISSGEHTITVTADTTNFYISVDSSVPAGAETVALAGSSVDDTDNDYVWLGGNTIPYADTITLDVGGVEKLKYVDPTGIISSATLPDQTGTYDGTFTWGSNPSGVSVTLGSMTSSGDVVSTSTGTSTNDLLPVVGGTDWNEPPDVSGALLTNPFRPIVTAISDNTTLSERQVWVWLGVIFVAFIIVLVGSRVRGHHLITGIAAGVAISLMVVFTIFPPLALLVVALAIFGGMVSERSPSL